MNTKYYKMANSNLLSNIEIVEYIKQSESFSNKLISSFSNAIFSSVVSVLVGIQLWDSMENKNIFLKIGIAFLSIIVLYFLSNFFIKKLLEFLKIFKDLLLNKKNIGEMSKTTDFFYTELQPEIVMGLSLSERIISPQSQYNDWNYKENLDRIYIHQCIFYLRKAAEDITKEKIYSYVDNPFERINKEIGYYAFYDTCNAVIIQLEKLRGKYCGEQEMRKNKLQEVEDATEKKLVENEMENSIAVQDAIESLLVRYKQFLGLYE